VESGCWFLPGHQWTGAEVLVQFLRMVREPLNIIDSIWIMEEEMNIEEEKKIRAQVLADVVRSVKHLIREEGYTCGEAEHILAHLKELK
jgi:hypothetical protein